MTEFRSCGFESAGEDGERRRLARQSTRKITFTLCLWRAPGMRPNQTSPTWSLDTLTGHRLHGHSSTHAVRESE